LSERLGSIKWTLLSWAMHSHAGVPFEAGDGVEECGSYGGNKSLVPVETTASTKPVARRDEQAEARPKKSRLGSLRRVFGSFRGRKAGDEAAAAAKGKKTRQKGSSEKASRGEEDEAWRSFERVSVLGRGSFGRVYLTRKRGGQDANTLYAEKVVRFGAEEAAVLRLVAGRPYVARLRYSFSRSPQLTSLVMDYAKRGTLEGRVVKSEREAALAFAELASAIESLHEFDVVHRDVKPSNILVDDAGHLVLTDFGLAVKLAPHNGLGGFCGSLDYAAPEILRKGVGYGKPVDWWALGCVVYGIEHRGLSPFAADSTRRLFENILRADPPEPVDDLVAALLDKNPATRLDATTWRTSLWLKRHNVDPAAVYARSADPPLPPSPQGSPIGVEDHHFLLDRSTISRGIAHRTETDAPRDDAC